MQVEWVFAVIFVIEDNLNYLVALEGVGQSI